MNYWWVNHKQTFRFEINEGYIWSPKLKNDGTRNQSYENLTIANVGDIIFSYADGQIKAVGVVSKKAISSPRPTDFGAIGSQWANDGWLVAVKWKLISRPIEPKKYILRIAPLLPSKYSPIKPDGNGNQGIYLASISVSLGTLLIDMIDIDDIGANTVIHDLQDLITEEKMIDEIEKGKLLPTTKVQLIEARNGQGFYRNEVEKIESRCRLTGLDNKSFLIAGHIKPWRDSSDAERLDGHNGFLLSPHVDKLFDKGYISFNDSGKILIASKELSPILSVWKLDPVMNVGSFTKRQKDFLAYHRDVLHSKKIKDLEKR
jgi:putative restriction endonuclease